jgi:activator of HSP90 ATPase
MNTQSLRQSVLVDAPPSAIYHALLDSTLMSRILRSPCEIEAHVGSALSLSNGQIVGSVLELRPDRRIVLALRIAAPGWDESRPSRVVLSLAREGAATRVLVEQTEVPVAYGELMAAHWHDRVWPGAKRVLEHHLSEKPRFRFASLLQR